MLKHELQSIISGKSRIGSEDIIQTTAQYLRGSKKTSEATKASEHSKGEETQSLIKFIDANKYWYNQTVDETFKIGEGAEQKVYFYPDFNTVIKLSDSIYYLFWLDYLHNLQLHNYFFPDTKYTLLGFILKTDTLFAVVEQPYIKSTEPLETDLLIKFLQEKGFENKKNFDFYNKQLGIILEDLHDENVIQNNGVLFFIDTVFFITSEFYQ